MSKKKEVEIEEQNEQMLDEQAEEPKEEKKSKEEIKHEKLREVRHKEEELLKAWRNSFDEELASSDCYFEMDNYIQMVAKGKGTGCIIVSSAGLGKSYRATSILNKLGVEYGYIDSYSSSAAFYVWLYKNRDKISIVDDVPNLFYDRRALSYLKAALWAAGVGEKRIVHNKTQKPLEDEFGETIPDNFEFTGRLVILTNQLPAKNPHVWAVLSRVFYTTLRIGEEEILRIMKAVAKKKFDGLDEKERMEAVEFIEKNAKGKLKNINLRTLIKLFQFREFAKDEKAGVLWQRLGLHLLKKEEEVVADEVNLLVEDLEKNIGLTMNQKVEKFMQITKKSRATYYRMRRDAGYGDPPREESVSSVSMSQEQKSETNQTPQ